jgi:cell wall-associated NlpC family hydrolase
MKRRILLFLSMVIAFSFMVAAPLKTQAASKVKISDKKVVLEIGQDTTVVDPITGLVTVEDNGYQLEMLNTDSDVSWSSSNNKVASVDEDGYVTPNAVGLSKITAKVNGKNYVCKVTVVDYTGMSIEQQEVVSFALQYVGNKYRYGGSSLTKGTDCSGYTMAVYKNFGYKLSHNAYAQMKQTESVKMSEIEPGDLIFYGSSKRSCDHVAMYIGNKKVVHASNETTGITISDYKYRKYVAVGRVLEEETYPEDVTPAVTWTAAQQ